MTAKGTAERPIIIRAADGESPLLTWPANNRDRQNNIEFMDCAHLVPTLDFNSTKRNAPFDVGAYESDGPARNPGWTIRSGFRR